jgi:hypothetical protein
MAQQWLSASDPFFSQYPGTYDESGYVAGPYDSQVAGLQSPQNWEAVAPQLGWTGPLRAQYIGPDGNVMEDYSPEFLNWIQSKRAEGYDFVTDASQINKDRQTIGFRLPTGEVTNQRTAKVGGFGDFFKEFVLPSVGAYFGAGALGNALAPVTNALTGAGGIGGVGGAAFADLAGGMLPEFGSSAAYSAGLQGAGAGALTAGNLTNLPTNIMGSNADVVGAGGDVAATEAAVPDRGFLEGMSETAATEGAGVAGTGILTKGTNIPSAVLGGGDLLDKALKFIQTPAGGAIVSGVGNVVGGIAAGSAAKEAAQTQAASADKALELQRDIYNKFMEMNKPYYEAGVNALGQITRGEVTAEPGYGFRLGEGMKALERLQASRGNLLSGGAMKAGQRFAQDLASEEYGKSFNRLANIAGIGQTAASQAGTAGQNYAGQAGELGMQGANALVSGRIGRTSAYTSGAKGAINALQGYQAQQRQDQLLNRMLDIYGRTGG